MSSSSGATGQARPLGCSALIDTTQAEVVDRAVREYAVRHADLIEKGIEHARSVLSYGDAGIAAHLLKVVGCTLAIR